MRRFNFDEFIWFILLFLLTSLWYYLISSGTVYELINISMVKYSYFALFSFAILTIFQLSKILTFPSRIDKSGKFIPLIFTLFMAVCYFSLNSFSIYNSSILSNENEVNFNYTDDYITINSNYSLNQNDNINDTKATIEKTDDNNYISSYNLIDSLNSDSEYIGKTISIVGYINRNDNFPKDTFSISRDEISCCLQDLRTFSILSKENKSLSLKNGSWVKALGIIRYEDGNAYLELIEISLIKEPEKKYI